MSDRIWKSSEIATRYLSGVRAAVPLAAEQIEVMLRVLAAGIPIRNFLDLGCGDGILAAAVLDRFPGARAVATDFSQPMLDAAQARLGPSATCLNSDYASPSWLRDVEPFRPFDAVVSGYSIHHQPDERKREVYAEIFGLLSPGGFFVNIEHVTSATEWIESIHDELFIDSLHRQHPDRPRDEVGREFYFRPDKAANILAPVERQCGWLREIGFSDVDCYMKIFEYAVFGGRRPANRNV